MVKKSDKIIASYVSLILEKHRPGSRFELKDVLFTREEITQRVRNLFPSFQAKKYEISQITLGEGDSDVEKFLQKGPCDSLAEYYRLNYPGELAYYDVRKVIETLLDTSWSCSFSLNEIYEMLESYFAFARTIQISSQVINGEIITREAIWIAAAVLTYNEYMRTKSVDPNQYFFRQRTIAKLAMSFNRASDISAYSQMLRVPCTHGFGNQTYAYLVASDDNRRISYYGEFENTQPEVHGNYIVNTITGSLTVDAIVEFIANEYSQIFYKKLMLPLDETHTFEEMEQNAAEMDPDSLRAAASAHQREHPAKNTFTSTHYHRDPYIVRYARQRAGGICQLCHEPAPFLTASGEPYLEEHHILWLSEGGSDTLDNVVALCPNCHRKMHIINDPNDVSLLKSQAAGV